MTPPPQDTSETPIGRELRRNRVLQAATELLTLQQAGDHVLNLVGELNEHEMEVKMVSGVKQADLDKLRANIATSREALEAIREAIMGTLEILAKQR